MAYRAWIALSGRWRSVFQLSARTCFCRAAHPSQQVCVYGKNGIDRFCLLLNVALRATRESKKSISIIPRQRAMLKILQCHLRIHSALSERTFAIKVGVWEREAHRSNNTLPVERMTRAIQAKRIFADNGIKTVSRECMLRSALEI